MLVTKEWLTEVMLDMLGPAQESWVEIVRDAEGVALSMRRVPPEEVVRQSPPTS